jgi:pyrroline-5-carboxylate reductase
MAATQRCELLVIGGGNMGSAIIRGGLAAGVLQAAAVCVVEPDAGKRAAMTALGCVAAEAIAHVPHVAELTPDTLVLWAVKPQMFADAAAAYRGVVAGLGADRQPAAGASIMAGVPASRISELTGTACIIRTMPNLPAQIGLGVTAICTPAQAGVEGSPAAAATRQATQLLEAVGTVMELPEPMLDAFTAVAGSGPAYVFYLAEAMVAAAMQQGLSADQADQAVRQTLLGAAQLMSQRAEPSPAQLRAEVTSKGGTTAAATAVMDGAGFTEIMQRAIAAGTERSRELRG